MQRRGDLGRRPQIDITSAQLLEGKLACGANDVVRATGADIATVLVLHGLRPAGLVGALAKSVGSDAHLKDRAKINIRRDNACLVGVLLNREQCHASTVNAPAIHLHALELGGNAGIEDALLHILRHARPVIQKDERTDAIFLGRGEIDLVGAGITSVAQHFDDNILDMLDVVLCLAPLGLRNAEADIPLAKVLLDAKVALPRHRRDK